MQVLLINPPQRVNKNFIDYPPFVSLGLWHTAAYLKSIGYEVKLLDSFAQKDSEVKTSKSCPEYYHLGISEEYLLSEIDKIDFDCVIIHLTPFIIQEPDRKSLNSIVKRIKLAHPQKKVIGIDAYIGGMNYIAYKAEELIEGEHSLDFIVRYESEEQLPELLKELGSDSHIKKKVIDGKALMRLPDLSDLPYRMVDLDAFSTFADRFYKEVNRNDPFGFNGDSIAVKASRGCPFNCCFCSSQAAGDSADKGWRGISTSDIEAQLNYLSKIKPNAKLVLLDESANSNRRHFKSFLALASKYRFKIEIPNGLRADLLDRDLLIQLKHMISILSISPESGNQLMLDHCINKKQKLHHVERVAKDCAEIGLPLAAHFIIGFPTETAQQINETFSLARKLFENYKVNPWIQFAIPVPGTPLYENTKRRGLLPDNEPSDLNPHFQGKPYLKDGACGIANNELVSMLKNFYQSIGTRQ